MRTKSLFDYDHEGTKNNKNDIFNYTQVYLKKVQFLSKKVSSVVLQSVLHYRIFHTSMHDIVKVLYKAVRIDSFENL